MPESSGLTVRQFQRESIHLSVEFVVADEHRGQVHFSQLSAAPGPFRVRGVAADISSGGLRLECPHFLPRMCEGMVRVHEPVESGDPTAAPVALEHHVKVRRVSMVGHEPTYAMGLSFIDPEPGLEQQVNRLLRMAVEASAAASENGGDDA